MAKVITPADYPTEGDYQMALQDEAEKCKHHANVMHESLDFTCFKVPSFEDIDRYLKMAESSIRAARKIIRIELEGREANRQRIQKTTIQKRREIENG